MKKLIQNLWGQGKADVIKKYKKFAISNIKSIQQDSIL